MKKKKVRITFDMVIDLDMLVDKKSFKKEWKNDINKLCKWLNG